MKAVFAGSFAVRLAEPVKKRLKHPCEIVTGDETAILPQLPDTDVLVSMGFDGAMAAAARRLRLLQVPGAGLDRIDRSRLRPGLALANAYGHEAGIAEYIMGAMIALTRSFRRIGEALLRPGTDGEPLYSRPHLGERQASDIGQALRERSKIGLISSLPAPLSQ